MTSPYERPSSVQTLREGEGRLNINLTGGSGMHRALVSHTVLLVAGVFLARNSIKTTFNHF